MRRTIVAVNQVAILFVAYKEMGHFESPARAFDRNMDVNA